VSSFKQSVDCELSIDRLFMFLSFGFAFEITISIHEQEHSSCSNKWQRTNNY